MAFFSKQRGYKVILQHDQCAEFLDPEVEKDGADKTVMACRRSHLPWYLTLVMLLTNVVLAALLIPRISSSRVLVKSKSIHLTNVELIDIEFSYRSAKLDIVTKRFNGTLFPPVNQSWSRLAPSSETDQFWDWYDPIRIIPLSEADIINMGKDPTIVAQFSKDWNAPPGSYLGVLDVFHKMHCLNQLRKMTFENYPGYGSPGAPKHHSDLQWIHLRHCVDILAQDIQCNANLDIIPFIWLDTQINPYPDFSIPRTCTNWDQFRDWTVENTLDVQHFKELRRPTNLLPISAEDGYYEMFGFEGSVLYPSGKGYKGRT